MSFGDDRAKQLSDGNSLGTVLGQSATDKVGFFGATPVAQNGAPAGNTHTPTAGSTTAAYVNTTFDGGIGSAAYTVGDIVTALKNLGLLKS
jgi:hypothetical protein